MKIRNDILAIIALSVLLAFLVSCDPVKRQARRCATCTLTSKSSDSTLVAVRERTVPVTVPGPTVHLTLPNPCAALCDSTGKLKDGVRINVSGTTPGTRGGTIFTRGDSLHILSEADSLRIKLTVRDSTIKRLITIENTVPARCELEHITKWDSFWIRTGQILSVLLVIIVINRLIRI